MLQGESIFRNFVEVLLEVLQHEVTQYKTTGFICENQGRLVFTDDGKITSPNYVAVSFMLLIAVCKEEGS